MRATLSSTRVELIPDQPVSVGVEVTNTSQVIDGVIASLDLGDGLSVEQSRPSSPFSPTAPAP